MLGDFFENIYPTSQLAWEKYSATTKVQLETKGKNMEHRQSNGAPIRMAHLKVQTG